MSDNSSDDDRDEMEIAESILDNVSPAGEHREASYELARCIRRSGSAARGADLFAVEQCGYSRSDWADITDRDGSTVSRNIRRAKKAEGHQGTEAGE